LDQVSAVTDQGGVQLGGTTTGDLDDDEGGGLVRDLLSKYKLHYSGFCLF
jgi:RNA-binding protein 39